MTQTLAQNQAYHFGVVRQFAVMTVVWGVVGMAVGGFLGGGLNGITDRFEAGTDVANMFE